MHDSLGEAYKTRDARGFTLYVIDNNRIFIFT